MKTVLFLCIVLMPAVLLRAQDTTLTGEYQNLLGPKFTFEIFQKQKKLMLGIEGQGVTELTPLTPLIFRPQHVRARATVEFRKDSLGHVDRMIWIQREKPTKWG